MGDPGGTLAIAELDALLSRLQAHRGDAARYGVLAEELARHLEDAAACVDRSDVRLAGLGKRLMREVVFAAKSAELRSPVARLSGRAGSGAPGKSGY